MTDLGGCTKGVQCKFQHPNSVSIKFIDSVVESECFIGKKMVDVGDRPKVRTQFLKSCQFKVPFKMDQSRAVCSYEPWLCEVKNCTKQHFAKSATPANSSQNQEMYRASIQGTLKPVELHQKIHVEKMFYGRSTGLERRTIIKIEVADSPKLKKIYEQRRLELTKVLGHHPDEIAVFHGTTAAAIQPIVNAGFSPNHRLHNAYGVGTYFALNPEVSVGYCRGHNQMFLCKVLYDPSHDRYVSGSGFYVIANSASCLPLFLITFA